MVTITFENSKKLMVAGIKPSEHVWVINANNRDRKGNHTPYLLKTSDSYNFDWNQSKWPAYTLDELISHFGQMIYGLESNETIMKILFVVPPFSPTNLFAELILKNLKG